MTDDATMLAMVLERPGEKLQARRLPIPQPEEQELLIKIRACGICRTDLHVVDGELNRPTLPLIPGHQIVGEVVSTGKKVSGFRQGDLVGIPWLGGTCGECSYCASGRENLCDRALFTGYQRNGGFAEYCTANADFSFPIPGGYPPSQAAPLLCAGLIGYRALRMAGQGKNLGVYGFGAAAHIVTQVALWQGRQVFAFTRPGDEAGQRFAMEMGAVWAGGATEQPPLPLDAAIIFAPAGELVPLALQAVGKGGIVVCAGIHMSLIPAFPYELLWGERQLLSVANLTRCDGIEFLKLAPRIPVRTEIEIFALQDANAALSALRTGKIRGAGVLVPPFP